MLSSNRAIRKLSGAAAGRGNQIASATGESVGLGRGRGSTGQGKVYREDPWYLVHFRTNLLNNASSNATRSEVSVSIYVP